MFGGNANSIVCKDEMPIISFFSSIDLDDRTLSCIIQRIINQITENAIKQRWIASDDDTLRQAVCEDHLTTFKS